MLRPVRALLLSGILACFLFPLLVWKQPGVVQRVGKLWPAHFERCPKLKDSNDIYLVFRTGSTEIEAKLFAHTKSTFACPRRYAIFSDHAETLYGEHVRDALSTISDETRSNHPDFELYRKLQRGGRGVLQKSELADGRAVPDPTNTGHRDNPGWKLDKWKFLPMVNATYHLAPNYKWYFFMEADTSVFWTTLLRYLEELDPDRASYIGSEHWIGKEEFAHGGSGFLVSNPAMKQVVELYSKDKNAWESYVDGHWAGDCVLGKAFKDAGVDLTFGGGMFRSQHPGNFNYGAHDGRHKPMWCLPSLTWHHIGADVLPQLHGFEKRWKNKLFETGEADKNAYIRYRDVFVDYVMPKMQEPKYAWDNGSKDVKPAADLDACEKVCDQEPNCIQYSFDLDKKECKTSTEPSLGDADPDHPSLYSNWVYDRVVTWQRARPECNEDLWLTP